MKKLLSSFSVAFILAGCSSSINLPNVNTPVVQSNINDEISIFAEGIHVILVCSTYFPNKYNKFLQKMKDFSTRAYNQSERSFLDGLVTLNSMKPYIHLKKIPITTMDDFIKLHNKIRQDKKLANEVINTALNAFPKKKCRSLKYYEKGFKDFANSTGKGHLL